MLPIRFTKNLLHENNLVPCRLVLHKTYLCVNLSFHFMILIIMLSIYIVILLGRGNSGKVLEMKNCLQHVLRDFLPFLTFTVFIHATNVYSVLTE